MANLETLTIEINGSAASASQGINQLIGSLSALGAKLDEQVGSVRAFSAALKDVHSSAMTGNGTKSALSALSSPATSKGIKQTTTAMKEFSKERHNAEMISRYGYLPILQTKGAEEVAKQILPANNTKDKAKAMADYAKAVDTTVKATDKAAKGTNELAKANKEVGRTTSSIRQASHASTSLWKQIGRIAKTMLIRTAIRALMKVAKQGLENYYQYSKSINGQFASAVDKLGVGATKAGNQLGAAIGSLLASVAPILSAIISLVNSALSALSALFSLLGGGSTFSEATDGMNAFAKATGGGGGAMKELLADFDEFNIIAQEGGGGGGGGGGFGGLFKESPIPDWMVEWKPLIEALLAGTLGAVVLPAILNGLKKIVDLFTGGGATNLLNFFKYLFRKDTPDFPDIPDGYKNFPTQPDYKPFPTQPEYKPFPTQPDYKAFPIEPPYTPLPVAPDYAKATAEMAALAAAANAALPAVKGIAAALTAIGGAQLLMNAVTTLLTKLAGATMKIKVDRKAFDDFKKEVEEWAKSVDTHRISIKVDDVGFRFTKTTIDAWTRQIAKKQIGTVFNDTDFQNIKKAITNWAAGLSYKHVNISVNQYQYQAAKKDIDAWTKENSVKRVTVIVTTSLFDIFKGILASWLNASGVKKVVVNMLTSTYDAFAKTLSNWLKKDDTKTVKVVFDGNSYSNFFKNANTINSWVNTPAYKQIYTLWQARDYNAGMQVISSWVREQAYKIINVGFDNRSFVNFWSIADAIDAWANQTLTKVINVVVNKTPNGGTKNKISDVADAVSKGATAAAGFTTTPKETGLGFKLESSLFAGDGGLTWNGQTILGNGGIVQNWINGLFKADGAYGIPNGDLFIANEAGAELVGSINGKTSVANQGQIIDGIQRGVAEANESQNALLRQQNELLRGILEKEMNVNLGASASFGRTVRQSLDMYNGMTGSR